MTTENNNSANALIAEFMGMKPHDPKELDGFWTNTIKAHKFDNVMNLQFNSDWNWLMEVIEKIFNTCEVTPNNLDCEWDILFKQIHNSFYCPKIEAVYNACVEFIKWYNQNNLQS